jgi:hypothetical protein
MQFVPRSSSWRGFADVHVADLDHNDTAPVQDMARDTRRHVTVGLTIPTKRLGVRGPSAVAIVIGFVKVRFVGLNFMELRRAPWLLRLVFEGWVVAVGARVSVLCVVGRGARRTPLRHGVPAANRDHLPGDLTSGTG